MTGCHEASFDEGINVLLLEAKTSASERDDLPYGCAGNMQKVSVCDEQQAALWAVLVAVGHEVLDELRKGHAVGLRFSEHHVAVEGHNDRLKEKGQGVIVDGERMGAVQPSGECSFVLSGDSSVWSPFSDDGGELLQDSVLHEGGHVPDETPEGDLCGVAGKTEAVVLLVVGIPLVGHVLHGDSDGEGCEIALT